MLFPILGFTDVCLNKHQKTTDFVLILPEDRRIFPFSFTSIHKTMHKSFLPLLFNRLTTPSIIHCLFLRIALKKTPIERMLPSVEANGEKIFRIEISSILQLMVLQPQLLLSAVLNERSFTSETLFHLLTSVM